MILNRNDLCWCKSGLKYKNCVLSCGGSENMDKLFFDFAQREPKIDSLLKIDGII